MRGIWFAPWWWYFWGTGKRFSFRRLIGHATTALLATEILWGAWLWASRDDRWAPLHALPLAAWVAGAVIAVRMVEPFWVTLGDSVRSGNIATNALRETGIGFTLWWAVVLGAFICWQAPHISILSTLLREMSAGNDRLKGIARFAVACILVCIPFVFVARTLLIGMDGARFPHAPRRGAPVRKVGPGIPPWAQPPKGSRPGAAPSPPPPMRPAKIISMEVGPLRRDDK